MLQLAVCDDEKVFRSDLRKILSTELELCGIDYHIEEFASGEELAARTKVYCREPVVNAVLSAKMQRAEEEGIVCECQVDLKEIPAVDDIDLCVLFANTLDNAIEACSKMKERQNRHISVKARCMGGQFSYEIINSKENTVTERDGVLATDKEDSGSHGIGLRSVRAVVDKYGGEMEVSYTDETFSVTVYLSV